MSRLKPVPGEVERYLALLEENPQRILECTRGLEEARLNTTPQKGEWSVAEVLGHLRACAEVWTNSIYTMLAADNPSLADIHPRRWIKIRAYELLGFQDSLKAYILQRGELLLVLRGLPEADWERTASIGGRAHSVYSQVRRMAKHEAEHCEQIEALLAGDG